MLAKRLLAFGAVIFVLCVISCEICLAEGPTPDAPQPSVETSAPVDTSPRTPSQHEFWDRKNQALFTGTAVLNLADFYVTRANLESGGRELNPLARILGRSTSGLAANFAGETAGVIGLSYFFHKTGYHKLERIVSLVNISASGAAVTYGLTHR